MVERYLLSLLLEVGREKGLITYCCLASRLNGAVGRELLPEKGRGCGRVAVHLHRLCRKFYSLYGVLPGSVVVSKVTGMPSAGYFKFLREMGINFSDEKDFWLEALYRFYDFSLQFAFEEL